MKKRMFEGEKTTIYAFHFRSHNGFSGEKVAESIESLIEKIASFFAFNAYSCVETYEITSQRAFRVDGILFVEEVPKRIEAVDFDSLMNTFDPIILPLAFPHYIVSQALQHDIFKKHVMEEVERLQKRAKKAEQK